MLSQDICRSLLPLQGSTRRVTVIEVDPDGDVLLKIERASKPFAVWNDNIKTCIPQLSQAIFGGILLPAIPLTEEKNGYTADRGNSPCNQCFHHREDPDPAAATGAGEKSDAVEDVATHVAAVTLSDSQARASTKHTGTFGITAGIRKDLAPKTNITVGHSKGQYCETADSEGEKQDANAGGDAFDEDVRIRVSSKHVTFACGFYSELFHGPWRDSKNQLPSGLVETAVAPFDVEALCIVMNVIHGKNRKVPKEIDLELLAKIAIVADYLQCTEPLENWIDTWIDRLDESLPAANLRDATLWVCIAWVFKRKDEFRLATEQVVLGDSIQKMGLPIPQHIVSLMKTAQDNFAAEAMKSLHDYTRALFAGRMSCSYACRNTLLADLVVAIYELLDLDHGGPQTYVQSEPLQPHEIAWTVWDRFSPKERKRAETRGMRCGPVSSKNGGNTPSIVPTQQSQSCSNLTVPIFHEFLKALRDDLDHQDPALKVCWVPGGCEAVSRFKRRLAEAENFLCGLKLDDLTVPRSGA